MFKLKKVDVYKAYHWMVYEHFAYYLAIVGTNVIDPKYKPGLLYCTWVFLCFVFLSLIGYTCVWYDLSAAAKSLIGLGITLQVFLILINFLFSAL